MEQPCPLLERFTRAVAAPQSNALEFAADRTAVNTLTLDAALRSGRAFGVIPARNLLALDVDAGEDVARDIHAMIEATGVHPVTVTSGRHHHVYAKVRDAADVEHLWLHIAGALEEFGLDGRARRAGKSRIRPPLSPYYSGAPGGQLLIPTNPDAAIHRLISPGIPHILPDTPAVTPAAIRSSTPIADYAGRSLTPSAAQNLRSGLPNQMLDRSAATFSVVMGCVWAGWSDAQIVAALDDPTHAGGAPWRALRDGLANAVTGARIRPGTAQRWLSRQLRRARLRTACSQAKATGVTREQLAVWLSEHRCPHLQGVLAQLNPRAWQREIDYAWEHSRPHIGALPAVVDGRVSGVPAQFLMNVETALSVPPRGVSRSSLMLTAQVIACHVNAEGVACISIRRMQERAALARSTVEKAVAWLITAGLIRRVSTAPRSTGRYEICASQDTPTHALVAVWEIHDDTPHALAGTARLALVAIRDGYHTVGSLAASLEVSERWLLRRETRGRSAGPLRVLLDLNLVTIDDSGHLAAAPATAHRRLSAVRQVDASSHPRYQRRSEGRSELLRIRHRCERDAFHRTRPATPPRLVTLGAVEPPRRRRRRHRRHERVREHHPHRVFVAAGDAVISRRIARLGAVTVRETALVPRRRCPVLVPTRVTIGRETRLADLALAIADLPDLLGRVLRVLDDEDAGAVLLIIGGHVLSEASMLLTPEAWERSAARAINAGVDPTLIERRLTDPANVTVSALGAQKHS